MRAMIGNSIITVLKFLTYLRTGSPAMLSETVHTLVDTGNQAILLVGLNLITQVNNLKISMEEGLMVKLLSICHLVVHQLFMEY